MTDRPCDRATPRADALTLATLATIAASCAAPPTAAPSAVPDVPAEDVAPLDLEGAAQLLATVTATWPATAHPELQRPSSLDDGMQILKRDQLTLFPAGVALARSLAGLEAMALEAQLELAWGESYLLVMAVLQRLDDELRRALDALPAAAAPAERAWLVRTLRDNDRYAEACQLLSIAHLTAGSAKADAVMAVHPDSYLGYRLAADYYRTVADWPRFDAMVSRIEALKPDSNGLVFLKGAAAFGRDRDLAAAARWFRQALATDPDFLRARAHLVMIQPDAASMLAELAAMQQVNPEHQLVRFGGPAMAWLASHH